MTHTDLTADAFLLLRDAFFDAVMQPVPFHLRPKENTQDDPLDEHISQLLSQGLADAHCQRASGPLINPDFVLYRPERCDGQPRQALANDTSRIVAVEVKKLQRDAKGRIGRASGLDYNTTPPCGTVRIYAAGDTPLDIRGFYLFVALEPAAGEQVAITALTLCDGNILNDDFDLYLAAIGPREKRIGLGTYSNGLDRQRPMFVFANPLGAHELDRHATLLTGEAANGRLKLIYNMTRTTMAGQSRGFSAYRKPSDLPADWQPQTLIDPFPQPSSRVSSTQPRGKFQLPIQVV